MYAVKREGEGEGEESSWPYPRRRRAREDEALTKQLLISLHKDEAEKRMLMLTLKRANITRPVVDPRAVSQLFFFFCAQPITKHATPPLYIAFSVALWFVDFVCSRGCVISALGVDVSA